ncbi:MAG: hypothetical protein WCK59_02495 [Candidatus Falkowbacteria bacterium]
MIQGIVIGLLSAVLSSYATIRIEKYLSFRSNQKGLFFDIYMKLMELEGNYFWLASSEIRKTPEPKEISQKVWQLKWQIADMSRKLEAKELQEILETLFINKFSHSERHERLNILISKFGYKANPRYKNIMAEISKQNLENNKEQFEKIKID